MSVTVYHLVSLEEKNSRNVERLVLDLQRKYREGIKLDSVELDWIDQANTWLDQNRGSL